MMKRKIVGIPCSQGTVGDWNLPMDYVRCAHSAAYEKAGPLPLLLPVTGGEAVRAILLDDLFLSSGLNIFPALYVEHDIHPAA